MSAITVNNISKRFRLPHHKKTTLFQNALGMVKRQMAYEDFWALKDISFEVERGESFGIIGRNGSGKSTLLKILARVLYPDSGSVSINGKVASFLELGVGFQPELTAAENIYIYASVLGMGRRETGAVYDQILDFAELKKFEDMKLKNYSSGMYTRLAFSTAVNCKPDIMLVDEVLSVGDEAFQRKCMLKISEFREHGKTIIFVSHSLDTVRMLCTRSMLLDKGDIVLQGTTGNVIKKYLNFVGGNMGDGQTYNQIMAAAKTDPLNSVAATNRGPGKLIGVDADLRADAWSAGNYFHLLQFKTEQPGTIDEIRINCIAPGLIKLGIYADQNGEPGNLIRALNSSLTVSAGCNALVFPPTQVAAGENYWLAYCADGNIVGTNATTLSRRRFKPADFQTFDFPGFAGDYFTQDNTYYDLISGWG